MRRAALMMAAILGAAGPGAAQCGDRVAGDCCTAGATPACDEADCCEDVCSVDPYCCDFLWDAICADLAVVICPGCPAGPPPANDDCAAALPAAAGVTPFTTINATTDGPAHTCTSSVCGGDRRLHNDVWFNWTATFSGPVAITSCAPGFNPKVTVYHGCDCNLGGWVACNDDDPDCQTGGFGAAFQATEGQCYKIRIGSATGQTGAADFIIGPVAIACPGTGDCCTDNGTPGCEDPECCLDVCLVDPFCCDVLWDQICADEAIDLCGCLVDCLCDFLADGDCCIANGTPTCEVPACCREVCEADSFCCGMEWDGMCADMARHFCPDVCPPASGDLDGDGLVGITDLLILLAAWGPCPDPPERCPADLTGDGTVGIADLILLLLSWGRLRA